MAKTDLPDLPKDQTIQYWSGQTLLGLVERHTAECIMKVAKDRGTGYMITVIISWWKHIIPY